jgi:2-oxoglutarate dehydrogenase E2 component (dihydrolipoamide succinyltransferase)
MLIEVKVPSVGESITSGVLGVWRKKSGEYVRTGDVLFEIETDKVTSEVYAEADGVLNHSIPEGTEVTIGQVVANIDSAAKAPAAAPAPAPAAVAAAVPALAPVSASAPAPAAAGAPLSPAVRRMVVELKVDPAAITGTGKGGRILKSDVAQHVENPPAAPAAAPAPAPVPAASGDRVTRRKMSPLRRKIADRLISSQQETASLTTFNEIDMSNLLALRSRFQERFQEKHGIKLGFMSVFLKAVVYALKRIPNINARIEGDEVVQNNFFDIGVAISTEKGLVVPVIRGADQLSLSGIELAIADYAKKARAGKITLPDLEGGCFSVTNGGTFGSLLSTPIINPPQSGILGMHSIQERPVAVSGRVEIRPMMYVALTYDHRLVDGKEAVTFLVSVKEFVEQPALGLLEL